MQKNIVIEDIKLVIYKLWINRLLVFFATLTGVFVALMVINVIEIPKYYKASATVYMATYGEDTMTSNDFYDLMGYMDIVTSEKVTDYAATLLENQGISSETIKNSLQVDYSTSSYVITISASYDKADTAIKIANAVADSFVMKLSEITGNSHIQILDKAERAIVEESKTTRNLCLEIIVTFFGIICGGIALRTLLSPYVLSVYQCSMDDDEILDIVPRIQ